MTENQGIKDLGAIGIIFQNKLLKVVEELRLKRESDDESEIRIKALVSEKYELENKIEKSVSESESINGKIDQLENKYKKIYEGKLMTSEDEKNQYMMINQRLSQELESLKDETRALELGKISLMKKLRDVENQLKIESSSRDKTVSKMIEINEEIHTVKKYQNDLENAQNRIENYCAKTMDYVNQLQSALKHNNCILENLKHERCKLFKELVKTRCDSKENEMNLRKEKELKERNVDLELQLQFKGNELKMLQTQLKNIKEDQGKMSSAIFEANVLMSKYLDATIAANTNAEMWKQQYEMQVKMLQFKEDEIESIKNKLQKSETKNYQSVEIQTNLSFYFHENENKCVEDLMNDLLYLIEINVPNLA